MEKNNIRAARVFKQKLKSLMDFIVEMRCWVYSVDWQKRGLPHAHILIWLVQKITPDQIDDVISAEIADPSTDPDLLEIVIKNMTHGPNVWQTENAEKISPTNA